MSPSQRFEKAKSPINMAKDTRFKKIIQTPIQIKYIFKVIILSKLPLTDCFYASI
jgi:hypothetical protein